MLKIYLEQRPVGRIAYGRLARATIGFSSADIKQLCDDAAAIPWKEAFKTGKEREVKTGDVIKTIRAMKSTLPPWYASANKEIGKQKEVEVIDGKKHVKEKESKLGPEEQEQFKVLIDIIKKKNKWYTKSLLWIWKQFAIWII
jgi:SpoVK/Ycf46/Vps4 family AAA+-type ATPase